MKKDCPSLVQTFSHLAYLRSEKIKITDPRGITASRWSRITRSPVFSQKQTFLDRISPAIWMSHARHRASRKANVLLPDCEFCFSIPSIFNWRLYIGTRDAQQPRGSSLPSHPRRELIAHRASCSVPPSDLLLRIGEHDLANEDEPYGYQERRVQIVASHPQFDARTFEYDLALLRFYEPLLPFQPNVLPICLPDDDETYVGQTAYVTGWGRLYDGKTNVPIPIAIEANCSRWKTDVLE